jgi:hypothetical protein
MTLIRAALLGLALSATAIAAQAETITLKTTLSGAAEVPSVTTDAKGSATVTLDTATKVASWKVEYSGLSGEATGAHIHGPAAVGANAGVAVPLTVSPSPITGQATLTDAQIADLLAGKDYINIHTTAHPSGEARGYLTK